MPSDTPRTDAIAAHNHDSYLMMRGHAETLERELASMTTERDGYAKRCAELESQLRQAMRGAT